MTKERESEYVNTVPQLIKELRRIHNEIERRRQLADDCIAKLDKMEEVAS